MNEFTSRYFTQLIAGWVFLIIVSFLGGINHIPGLGELLTIGIFVALGIALHRRPDEFGTSARLLFWCFVLLQFALSFAPSIVMPVVPSDLLGISLIVASGILYWLFFTRIWYSRTQPLSKERGYVLFLTTQGLIVPTLALATLIYDSLVA